MQPKHKNHKPVPRDPETMRKAAERQEIAKERIAAGVPQVEIVKELINGHQAHWRVAYSDIQRARGMLAKGCAKRGTDEAIGEMIARCESHYVRCIQAGELGVGLQTLKLLGELTGALQLVDKRVAAMQVNISEGKVEARALSLEAFNSARSIFGIPELEESEYAQYKAAHRRKVIALPDAKAGTNSSGN